MNDPLSFADLQIRILPRSADGSHPVEVSFSGEQEFPAGRLDPALLAWVPEGPPEEDGERLFAALLGDPRLRDAWAEARGLSEGRRVRLWIDASEPRLHALPWELLRESAPDEPSRLVAADPGTPFSRYLAVSRPAGRPVLARPVRLLAAVANPRGLAEEYGLDPLDVEAERRSLEQALAEAGKGEIEMVFFDGPVTLPALEEALRSGGFHVLHLMAHGAFDESLGSALFLADPETGGVAFARERQLAELLDRQGDGLRLVFLASCESAKRTTADAFRGLAPALISAGVPAVVAMQDQVSIGAARTFAATFYRRLVGHGQVDLAANEARAALLAAGSPDAATPVLFLRLRSGRLFGRRGEIQGESASLFWSTLLRSIADGNCLPIVGPGVTQGALPLPSELALNLPVELDLTYPFSDGESLPHVAQFVGAYDPELPRREILRLMTRGFRRRYGLPGDARTEARLSAALRAAGWPELVRERDEGEIHHQLADLGLPLYLTTNFDNLLTLALEARGRRPRRETLDWRGEKNGADEPSEETADEPLILHLFGTDEEPESMVLTEDDCLDYLARISRAEDNLLPGAVGDALARKALLFLGYRLGDLDLKILLRGFLAHLDHRSFRRLQVAVQVDPREAAEAGCNNARLYLEKYFGDSDIKVYWGTVQQFVADLHERWMERYREGTP